MFSANSSQVSNDVNYIESCFSTYLYTGNGSTQTITNGIDLSTKGALTWIKDRGAASTPHMWFDTDRGVGKYIQSNSTGSQGNIADTLTAFNSNGFTLGADSFGVCNASGHTYASWTFRKQPKFYTQGTYTGNGTGTSIGGGVLKRDIAHDLGSTPGCVIIKNLDTGNWVVYHRSSAFGTENLRLNTTGAGFNASGYAPIYEVSSTTFSVIVGATGLSSSDNCNINGASYVYYMFAHNAGGFGLTGTDNVISCGSYTGNSSSTNGPVINLGYEPQWLLVKCVSGEFASGTDWQLLDNMRGVPTGSGLGNSDYGDRLLVPNTSAAEVDSRRVDFTATGFKVTDDNIPMNRTGHTFIYIAIRRGPMKVPTSGTSVFSPNFNVTRNTVITTGFPVDLGLTKATNAGGVNDNFYWSDRLRGQPELFSNSTAAETDFGANAFDYSTGWLQNVTNAANTPMNYAFRRAPSFFDEVCYTGTGSARTINHNLGVAPELMIVKCRAGLNWIVYCSHQTSASDKYLFLNTTASSATASNVWNSTAPTSSVFSIGTSVFVNEAAGINYVAYLFATCAGVSKVGSYTGTGTTQAIDCGFAAGARFVLIKRTDSTGDWYVWDTARGIVSGNDPYLLLNSTAAEVTITDYIDTYSAGFELSTTAAATVNVLNGTYIFFAVA